MVEGPVVRPQPLQQHQIFVDALPDHGVADRTRLGIVVIQRLAQHPQRQPAAAPGVERRQLPRRNRRRDHAGPVRQHHFQRRGAVQRLGGDVHIGQQPGRVVDDDVLEAGILDQRQLCRRLDEIIEERNGRTGVGGMRFTGNMRELDRHCHLLHHVGCMSPKSGPGF
ncbi:hypothetical protein NKJ83_20505 [Mesorhizobium sp. M0036]